MLASVTETMKNPHLISSVQDFHIAEIECQLGKSEIQQVLRIAELTDRVERLS